MTETTKISNREFFADMLGFDPGKDDCGGEQVVAKAVKELQEKRAADAVERLKGIITKVGELCRKRDQARSAYLKEEQKFEKELGNLRKQVLKIQNGSSGISEESEETVENNDS